MREEYLHYIWRFQHFDHHDLTTNEGEKLEVLHPGFLNHHAGPDFGQASIHLDGMAWHGPVEIHLKSSDWIKHGHQHDVAYDHVILHVVLEHDQEVTTSSGRTLPTLELKGRIDKKHILEFERKLPAHHPIPCGVHLNSLDDFLIRSWVHRMAIDRLESKWESFKKVLDQSSDWNQAASIWLARSYGFGLNGNAFQHLAERIDWKFFIKYRDNPRQLLALVLGQAGWLGEVGRLSHPVLDREYKALQHMHGIHPMSPTHWNYGKVHPANHPHKRAVQWALVQSSKEWSLAALDDHRTLQHMEELVKGSAELLAYANQLFPTMFGLPGSVSVQGVLGNGILPLRWFRARWLKKQDLADAVIDCFNQLPPEDNKTVRVWKAWGVVPLDRLESQGLLQLYRTLCSRKKCLSCLIGLQTLKPSSTHHETDI